MALRRMRPSKMTESRDRQIGDRRGEPSRVPHQGPFGLLNFSLRFGRHLHQPKKSPSFHCTTDRKDLYHQIWASPSRAVTDSLGPGLEPSLLEGIDALNLFLLEKAPKGKKREDVGDGLGRGL